LNNSNFLRTPEKSFDILPKVEDVSRSKSNNKSSSKIKKSKSKSNSRPSDNSKIFPYTEKSSGIEKNKNDVNASREQFVFLNTYKNDQR